MRGCIIAVFVLSAATAWSFERQTPNGTTYNSAEASTGALSAPAAFAGWGTLCVRECADCTTACGAGDLYSAPNGDRGEELNGLQYRMGVQQLAGLDVRRKVFIPSAGGDLANGFIRFFDSLTNNTGAQITVSVRFGAQAGGGVLANGMRVWRTHSDDATIEPTDRWAVVDDDNANGGLGAVGVLVQGAGARNQPARFGMGYPNEARPTSLAWDFDDVVVAPGQTVAFLTLVIHENARLAAIDETSNLVRVRDVDALFGLSDDDRRAVRNFDIEPGLGTPVADAGGPYAADEGSQVQLAASGYDPELGALTYLWDLDDDGEFDDAEGSNAVVIFPDDGPRIVRVQVTDGAGEIDVDAARVTIRNVIPVIEGVNANQPIDEGSVLEVQVLVNDPGEDELLFDFDWDGDGEFEDIGLDTPPFEHRYFDDGNYNARVRVRDDEGGEVIRAFAVEVVNVAPTVRGIAAPNIALEGAEILIQVQANDPGRDEITYEYDIDGDGEYDREGVELAEITVVFPDDALVALRVRVTDDQGLSSFRDHNLAINNDRPVIVVVTNSGPAFEGEEVVIDVEAVDAGEDELTYSFDFDNDGAFDIVDQADSFAGTVFDQQGEHTVGVRVRDDDGGLRVDTTVVTVNNAAPTAEVVAPGVVDEGAVFEVCCPAEDPGDDNLSYDWDLTGNGEYDQLGAEACQNASFDDQGTFNISCRVRDGDGGEVVATARVLVRNVAPGLSLEFDTPQQEGALVAVRAVVDDPGNDELRFFFDFDFVPGEEPDYEIENSPDEIGRYRYPDEGRYIIQVLVDDGSNLIDLTDEIIIENAAPSVDLVVNSPVAEGELVRFEVNTEEAEGVIDATFVDLYFDTPCGGDVMPAVEDADIGAEEPDEGGDVRVERRALDGLDRSRVCACARDEDGGRACVDAELVVTNVEPSIPEFDPIPALEGSQYNVGIPATDPANPDGEPANDPLLFELQNPPAGIEMDRNTGIIGWIPNFQNYLDSPIELNACVEDGDGGRACVQFEVDVGCIDDDVDDLCDTWERNTCNDMDPPRCLDPTNQADGTEDPDEDGRQNWQEEEEGTNPWVYEGPLVPDPLGPDDEACTDTLAPTFELSRVEDELERPITLQFLVCSDSDCVNVVADSGWVPQPEMGGTTWTPEAGLLFEDQVYFWVGGARVENAAIPPEVPTFVMTPQTDPRWFRTNATNSPPSPPTARAPEDGSAVSDVRPTLEVLPSVDPDGICDTLIYRFRIYRADTPFTTGEGELDGDVVRFNPTEDLIENGTFQWDVVSVDGPAVASEPSERWTFTIDTENQPPDTPVLVAPENRSTVTSLTPEFIAEGSTDLDVGDTLYYHFKVRVKLGNELGDVVVESEDIEEDENGQGIWVPETPLEEDSKYQVEVYATDGEANSDVVDADFTVSSEDACPGTPMHVAPADNSKLAKKNLLLDWSEVLDPEGGDVVYDLELCRGDACSTFEVTTGARNVENDVFEGAVYTWRVQSVDGNGNTCGYTDPWTFTVEAPDEDTGSDDDCGCSAANDGPGSGAIAFVALLLIGLRRRSRRA